MLNMNIAVSCISVAEYEICNSALLSGSVVHVGCYKEVIFLKLDLIFGICSPVI